MISKFLIRDKNRRFKIEENPLHRLLSSRRYIPEFRALVLGLYKHGYRIHTIERAYKTITKNGLSTRTLWTWINNVKIKGIYHIKNTWSSVRWVIGTIKRFLRWLRFKSSGGFLDLEACLKGEEPP